MRILVACVRCGAQGAVDGLALVVMNQLCISVRTSVHAGEELMWRPVSVSQQTCSHSRHVGRLAGRGWSFSPLVVDQSIRVRSNRHCA